MHRKIHRTIKIGLICKKLELGSEFNLEISLDKILFNYNNTVHSAIGYKPIEVFYSTSETLYEEIYYNTMNSFKYIHSRSTNFVLYEKVLLFNNFIIENKNETKKIKRLSKNKVKKPKTLFNICASICKIYNNGFYDIIIEKSYIIYNLDKYDICQVNSVLLKKISEFMWDEIYYSDQ